MCGLIAAETIDSLWPTLRWKTAFLPDLVNAQISDVPPEYIGFAECAVVRQPNPWVFAAGFKLDPIPRLQCGPYRRWD